MSFKPSENEWVQISGTVEGIIFRNESTSFTVLDINSNDELITAVGVIPELTAGEKINLTGWWDINKSFGRQFRIEKLKRSMPETASDYLKYLSSGAIKGIGPKTAKQIVDRFGENTFDVLEFDPERLTVIKGFSERKAFLVSEQFKQQMSLRTVILGLEKFDLTASESIRIYREFGKNSVHIIEENPYILCGRIEGFSFDRAEEIAGKLSKPVESRYRTRAGINYVLRHNLFNGHTCLPRNKLVQVSSKLLSLTTDETESGLEEMIKNKMLISHNRNEKEFIAIPEIFFDERNISEKIKLFLLLSSENFSANEKIIDEIEKENDIKYAELQREAIRKAASNGVFILTGGPGTGKTTTVRGIISFFHKLGRTVTLAAPTGRAAKRMSELTGMDSKTIHRLLEVEWSKEDKLNFKKNEQNPLETDVLIVDEASMIDVELFSNLINACKYGTRIILVGDSNQLPAVGPGNVLDDLISSGIVPFVKLTVIFRQAMKSLIITNAHDVIEGKYPNLNEKNNDFFFMKRENPIAAKDTIVQLCTDRLSNAYGYSPLDDIQILCPSRKGECGTVNLNLKMQQSLNPPSPDKAEVKSGLHIYREGDKIMETRNNYDLAWTKGEEKGAGIFNGEIGIIEKINNKEGSVKIKFDDGKISFFPFDFLHELELAYAVTVHKSQGSEYNAVVMPVADVPPKLLYRNLLYTAITRAKKQMIIVGREDLIEKTVDNNVQNKRYSFLKYLLLEGNKQ